MSQAIEPEIPELELGQPPTTSTAKPGKTMDELHFNIRHIGIATVNLKNLERHWSQRPLDQTFVNTLASQMAQQRNLRDQFYIHVVLGRSLIGDERQQLALGTLNLEDEKKMLIIDGQHRVHGWMKANSSDSTWPAFVYDKEVGTNPFLGVWMGVRNDTTLVKGTIFPDLVTTLSKEPCSEKRDKMIRFVVCSKQREALSYLSQGPCWQPMVEMFTLPLYSGLVTKTIIEWRVLGERSMQDFLALLFEEMKAQRTKIENYISESTGSTFTLKTEHVHGESGVPRSGSEESVRDMVQRKGKAPLIFSALSTVVDMASNEDTIAATMRWVATTGDGEGIRELAFGRMIPLPNDLKFDGPILKTAMRMQLVMKQTYLFMTGKGGEVGNKKFTTWKALLGSTAPTKLLTPEGIDKILRYIYYNHHLLISEEVARNLIDPTKYSASKGEKRHIPAPEAHEHWLLLEELVTSLGVPFTSNTWWTYVEENRKFKAQKQARTKKTPSSRSTSHVSVTKIPISQPVARNRNTRSADKIASKEPQAGLKEPKGLDDDVSEEETERTAVGKGKRKRHGETIGIVVSEKEKGHSTKRQKLQAITSARQSPSIPLLVSSLGELKTKNLLQYDACIGRFLEEVNGYLEP